LDALAAKHLICSMFILENDYLQAAIASQGAELQSLVHKETGIEHMWSGDAAYWPKYSPVLFPIVGLLKDETYFYNGQSYKLPRHGFAREKKFAAVQLSDSEVLFTLMEDDQSLTVFPFEFVLNLRYRLSGYELSCSYEVTNPGSSHLLFSVGAHPAFAVPFTKDTAYTDYYLEFNKPENLQRFKLDSSLVKTTAEPLPLNDNRLQLQPALFYEDAIVLKKLQSNRITLGCSTHAHGIHFSFNDFPFFGIWAAKDAPFVCLEPWCGIADAVNHDQQLEHKEGINTLAPGAEFKRIWAVECF
jgi:galactose mutarotase-like enzyme